MTLNQLRYFCTASRCHSITKAAEELYVTQPTVSTAIRDLEIEFGISLFYRKGNQLILTGEGETLYEKANYIPVGLFWIIPQQTSYPNRHSSHAQYGILS